MQSTHRSLFLNGNRPVGGGYSALNAGIIDLKFGKGFCYNLFNQLFAQMRLAVLIEREKFVRAEDVQSDIDVITVCLGAVRVFAQEPFSFFHQGKQLVDIVVAGNGDRRSGAVGNQQIHRPVKEQLKEIPHSNDGGLILRLEEKLGLDMSRFVHFAAEAEAIEGHEHHDILV